jgi:hypothetical protein
MSDPQRPPSIGRSGGWMVAALAVAWLSPPALAATLDVGAGKTYANPSAAAAAAHDGDHIRIAAGSYADCAIWRASNLTIEGAGPEATIVAGTPCAGKGLFITQGNAITIRDLMLSGARVPDANGAGIRAEGGDLTVERVRFVDNQNGILANTLPGKTIIVRNSVFIRNGTCEGRGGCAHGIYAGGLALLHVENSRFFETRHGHSIKSRAQRTEIIGCDISDGAHGTSSYAVEVPNGGAVILRDTRIQKGPRSENHTAALAIGAEGTTRMTPEIIVENTRFLVEGDYHSYLVYNLTTTEAKLKGNILQGHAQALRGAGVVK